MFVKNATEKRDKLLSLNSKLNLGLEFIKNALSESLPTHIFYYTTNEYFCQTKKTQVGKK